MAKSASAVPMPTSGGSMGKVVRVLLLIGLFVLIIQYPAESAEVAKAVASGLGSLTEALMTFGNELSN